VVQVAATNGSGTGTEICGGEGGGERVALWKGRPPILLRPPPKMQTLCIPHKIRIYIYIYNIQHGSAFNWEWVQERERARGRAGASHLLAEIRVALIGFAREKSRLRLKGGKAYFLCAHHVEFN